MSEYVFGNLTIHEAALEESPEVTTIHEMAGIDTSKMIQLNQISYGVSVPMESSTGANARGARKQLPIKGTIPLGATGPLIQEALTRNRAVSGEFFFFRQNAQSGETEHFYTLRISGGRFAEVVTESPDCFDSGNAQLPVLLHFSLVAHTTEYEAVIDSKVFVDNWSQRA